MAIKTTELSIFEKKQYAKYHSVGMGRSITT